jgi:ATP-binding cassette, subfamily B, bacterial MsbA
MQSPPPTVKQRLVRLLPYTRNSRGTWLAALLATAVVSMTEPLIPAMLKPLLDRGFQQGSLALWTVPAALLGIFGIRGLAGFVAQLALSRVANDAMVDLRRQLFQRVLLGREGVFRSESASSLSNTVVYEVQNGSNLLVSALLSLTRDSITLLALLVYLLTLNWKLTLIVALLFPAVAWVMKRLSHRLYALTRLGQQATDRLAYVVEENVLAHRTVRVQGAQTAQAARFELLSKELRRLAVKSTAAAAAMTPITQMLAAAALSAVISVALWQNQSAGVSVGEFAAFVTAMLMLVSPIKHLSEVANPITRGLASIERGLDLLNSVVVETSGQRVQPSVKGLLELINVSVSYDGAPSPALSGVSLRIAPGETVALVGPSGSGKTTLIGLIPRFIDLSSGDIELDGTSLRDWNLENLRSHIALVSQDVVLFKDTVAANVALGQPIDTDRIEAALQAANLGEWLESQPLGMATEVGHNGQLLSGGQRQRLAIARAIYRNASILLLDEATSALDNESEKLVQEALQRLMLGRTTLVVAHRLSTIEHADRIIVMASGRVVEQGSHALLLAQGGLYAQLHRMGFESPGPGSTP